MIVLVNSGVYVYAPKSLGTSYQLQTLFSIYMGHPLLPQTIRLTGGVYWSRMAQQAGVPGTTVANELKDEYYEC